MRPLRVLAASDLGPQFMDNPHRMVGQDGAFSIPLSDGTALWYFGDTVVGVRTPGDSLWYDGDVPIGGLDMSGKRGVEYMPNNCGLILRDRTGANGLRDYSYILNEQGRLRTLLPLEGDEHPDRDRIWCQHGIELDGQLILSFIKVKMFEGPLWPFPVGFEIVGSGYASAPIRGQESFPAEKRFLTPFGEFARVRRGGESVLWKADEPHFGVAFLLPRAADGYVYVYGTVKRGERQLCHVARVKRELILDPSAFEYFTGANWSADVADATPVLEGMPSEVSISWNAHLGCYLAVHSALLTGEILGKTSPTPWGPWSDATLLWHARPQYKVPEPYIPLLYAGKEHPSLADDGGRMIYVTYIEFEEYYPHLIRVELE
jgi:hypothetical protein